jgi:hypothetical protein
MWFLFYRTIESLKGDLMHKVQLLGGIWYGGGIVLGWRFMALKIVVLD